MSPSISVPTCIYCEGPEPFSDEHVFPAGMGGDDEDYILRDLVCQACNTKAFSPLEAQLMRHSPVGLARLLHQPTGRKRGSKASATSVNFTLCELTDPVSGEVVEAGLLPGGAATVLPQIQIRGDAIRLSVSSDPDVDRFLASLRELLGTEVTLIRKVAIRGRHQFELERLAWHDGRYQSREMRVIPKIPKGLQGLWMEPWTLGEQSASGWPRLFQRATGQCVLRLPGETDAAEFLRIVRRQLDSFVNPERRAIESPHLHGGIDMRPGDVFRAMLKIGVNFACHEYGEQVARSPGFRRIKDVILRGTEMIPPTPMEGMLAAQFTNGGRDVHRVVLLPSAAGQRKANLMVGLQLYGGATHFFPLAGGLALPQGSETLVFVVHYLRNKVERLTLPDYVARYVVPQGEASGLEPGQGKLRGLDSGSGIP